MKKHKKKHSMELIYTHITSNAKEYFSVIIVLLIGIVLGVIALNNSNLNQKEEIETYINSFVEALSGEQNIDKISLLKSIFINNLILVIGLVFAGSTVIGIPIVYAIVAYKGFCFSYTVSSIIAVLGTGKGIAFALSAVLLQNLVYIPCILALAVSGIRLYKSIIKDKRKENIKLEILRHIMFSILMGIAFLIGSLIEVYVSTNLVISVSKFI